MLGPNPFGTPRSLAGKIVVVTGASAGIGRSTAFRLASRGARVVAVARSEDELQQMSREASGIAPFVCDLTDDSARADLVRSTIAEHGRVDVLVNNLGVGKAGRVVDMDLDTMREVIDTNITVGFDLARLLVPPMVERGDGDVVFVASGLSWFATPPLTLYAATKYAVEGFAEGLRREVGQFGVRVHSIHPGPIATEFAARAAGDEPGDLDGKPAESGPGISPEYVAAAIERALVRPGTHMYSVPRVLGATRLVKLPVVQQVADLVVSTGGDRLAQLGRTLAQKSAGGSRR